MYFSKKQTEQFISQTRGQGDKPDCRNVEEIKKFEGIVRNYTYTIGVECVSQLGILSNNNGVICKLRKRFLKEKLFKIDLAILKSTTLK